MPFACQLGLFGLLLFAAESRCREMNVSRLSGAAAVMVLLICFFTARTAADFAGSMAVVVKTSGWQSYHEGVRVVWARRGKEAAVQLSDGRMFGPDIHGYWTAITMVTFGVSGYLTGKVLLRLIKWSRKGIYEDIILLIRGRARPAA